MKFSERIGKNKVRQVLQIESIDHVLENKLWNNIYNDFINQFSNLSYTDRDSRLVVVYRYIWENFFNHKADEISAFDNGGVYIPDVTKYIKEWFIKAEWFEKYDLIEFLAQISTDEGLNFSEAVKQTLKNELAGYTIIENKIVQISSDLEVMAIEDAINNSSKYQSVETHLIQSLELLSNRNSPDYRNSIKESISAVEAYCSILTNNPKATLGLALKQLEKDDKIHSYLKSSFSALYGYSSDSGGIRHSLLEDDIIVTINDAKLILVCCCAFINFLKSNE